MNIEGENLDKLEQLQRDLEQEVEDQGRAGIQQDPNQSEGKETLQRALYLFGEMGNEKLKGLHDKMGVPEQKLSKATDLLGEAISKHINVENFQYSIEAAAGLYIGSLAVQQWRIYESVKHEIHAGDNSGSGEPTKTPGEADGSGEG